MDGWMDAVHPIINGRAKPKATNMATQASNSCTGAPHHSQPTNPSCRCHLWVDRVVCMQYEFCAHDSKIVYGWMAFHFSSHTWALHNSNSNSKSSNSNANRKKSFTVISTAQKLTCLCVQFLFSAVASYNARSVCILYARLFRYIMSKTLLGSRPPHIYIYSHSAIRNYSLSNRSHRFSLGAHWRFHLIEFSVVMICWAYEPVIHAEHC